MVSNTSMIMMGTAGIIALLLPFIFILVLRKWFRIQWIPMIVGAAVFIIFVQVLEQISHLLVLRPGADGSIDLVSSAPWLYVLYGILAAGIFEETGRLVAFLLMKRKYHTTSSAVSYGIGHGGIEAVLIVTLGMLSTLIFAVMLNSGTSLPDALPGGIAESLVHTPAYMYGVSIFERVLAIVLHIALSVIVFQAVMRKGKWWLYILAIILHALANLTAAMYQAGMIGSIIWVYAGMVVVLIATIYTAWKVSAEQRKDINLI